MPWTINVYIGGRYTESAGKVEWIDCWVCTVVRNRVRWELGVYVSHVFSKWEVEGQASNLAMLLYLSWQLFCAVCAEKSEKVDCCMS